MSASNPLDDGLDEGADDTLSKTDVLNQYMAGLGFAPKAARQRDTLEYAKVYTDPVGRTGRAVVVVKKDAVGLEPASLAYSIVTIQVHVAPLEDEIRASAPLFCRQDLLRVAAHFNDSVDRMEAAVECPLCGVTTPEHQEVDGQQVCLDCARRKGF